MNNQTKYTGKTFITLGDSITWQDGKEYSQGDIGVIAKGYQRIIQERLGFSSYDNMGISGRPMANGTCRGEGTNTTGKNVHYTSHDVVIIATGTNDFRLDVPMGSKGIIGDSEFDTHTFYGAYRDLIEYILNDNPLVRVVLFTPLQRDSSGYHVDTINNASHRLVNYVNAIVEIGEMYGIPVCDMYRNSGFNKLTLGVYTLDGLHPNDVGYERIGDYASSFLNSI